MTSANWGVSQTTAMVIYKAVFLPRITYASEIWQEGTNLKKAIGKLGSMQRQALFAVTGAYKTTSTHALQVIASVLPLDLEIKKSVLKKKLRNGEINENDYDEKVRGLLDTQGVAAVQTSMMNPHRV